MRLALLPTPLVHLPCLRERNQGVGRQPVSFAGDPLLIPRAQTRSTSGRPKSSVNSTWLQFLYCLISLIYPTKKIITDNRDGKFLLPASLAEIKVIRAPRPGLEWARASPHRLQPATPASDLLCFYLVARGRAARTTTSKPPKLLGTCAFSASKGIPPTDTGVSPLHIST